MNDIREDFEKRFPPGYDCVFTGQRYSPRESGSSVTRVMEYNRLWEGYRAGRSDGQSQQAQGDAFKEKALEVVSAIRSVNREGQHIVRIEGDDDPCYWQRKEWIDWMLDLAFELELEANASAPPAPAAVPDYASMADQISGMKVTDDGVEGRGYNKALDDVLALVSLYSSSPAPAEPDVKEDRTSGAPWSDFNRLLEFAAIQGLALRDGDDPADECTDAWRMLPDHIQERINNITEAMDSEGGE